VKFETWTRQSYEPLLQGLRMKRSRSGRSGICRGSPAFDSMEKIGGGGTLKKKTMMQWIWNNWKSRCTSWYWKTNLKLYFHIHWSYSVFIFLLWSLIALAKCLTQYLGRNGWMFWTRDPSRVWLKFTHQWICAHKMSSNRIFTKHPNTNIENWDTVMITLILNFTLVLLLWGRY
jgi:hypothetical protein